jgi:hypothetical protein
MNGEREKKVFFPFAFSWSVIFCLNFSRQKSLSSWVSLSCEKGFSGSM